MIIREEVEVDVVPIESVTSAAFDNHPFSSNTEQFIIRALRANGNLPVSLVAEVEGVVVGHVAFSRVTIADGSENWFGLGPVSVEPGSQNKGIGSNLIRAGLQAIQSLGANGCVVLGDPKYYARFGFEIKSNLSLAGVPPEYFQTLVFGSEIPVGEVNYDIAFEAKS